MNFLDAHKIVHNYGKSLSKGANKKAFGFRPVSFLENTKDEIVDAHKLFYAHMLHYLTRTSDEFDTYQMAFSFLKYFIDDEKYNEIVKCAEIVSDRSFIGRLSNKRILRYAQEIVDATLVEFTELENYRAEEISDYFQDMQRTSERAHEELRTKYISNGKKPVDYFSICDDYCQAAYVIGNISMDKDDCVFFYKFELMRELLSNPEYYKIVKDYANYIRNNK